MTTLLLQALAAVSRDPQALVAVVGPTASGKTALAVELAARLDGEIVNADSVQIYREFDMGSGKPTPEERARARHHLVDAADPLDPVDAARFVELANRAIVDIRARGRRPIVCGGTFLWVKALIYGLADAPGANLEVRARHRAVAETEGRDALHRLLRDVDAASATRLHPNDFVRVSRALEVYEVTGKPLSAWHADHGFKVQKHTPVLLGVAFTPEALTTRIEQRCDAWLRAGWVDEVRALCARGYEDARAMGSVGYRDVRAFVRGELAEAELRGAIVRATRVFARRQRTWLKSEPITWIGG